MTGNSGGGKWAFISIDGVIQRVKAADVPKDTSVLLWTQDEVTPETSTGLLEMIRREQEDRARTIIESGRMGDEIHGVLGEEIFGNGPHAKVLRASIGDSDAIRDGHRRSLKADAEKRSPGTYYDKVGSPKKLAAHQTPPADLAVKDKLPRHLSAKDFIKLYSAVSFANRMGVALNAHLSIRWDLLGITDHVEAAALFQDSFLRYLNQWHRDSCKAAVKKGEFEEVPQLCWVYVHECPPPYYSFHTHFLIGLPFGWKKKFETWVRERLEAISKVASTPKNAIKVVSPRKRTILRQWIWFQYLSKGLDPKATVTVQSTGETQLLSGFNRFHYISPGPIRCERQMGMSQSVGTTKRKEMAFKSEMDLGRFDKRTLYTSDLFDEWHAKQAEATRRAAREKSAAFNADWLRIVTEPR